MGGQPSFEAFYAGSYPGIARSLTVALRDGELAEEAAQEAFVRAYVSWRRVGSMERPAGWVYVVAVRVALKRRSKPSAVPAPPIEAPLAQAVVDRESLRVAIEQLPERQRLAIVLRYLGDCSLAEVASAMGCALGTVKSTLNAALARLGIELADDAEEVRDHAG